MKKQIPEETQKTILVADDDEAILQLVSTFLARNGFHVLTAQSGEEAMKQSKQHKGQIHLVISNIQMTDISGIELCTRLSQERPDMKIMLMSGYASGMLILDSSWQFLPKPFVPSQLRDLVMSILATPNYLQGIDLNERNRWRH